MTKEFSNIDDAIISWMANHPDKLDGDQQDAVSRCLKAKRKAGKKIDDQAVAICISEAKRRSKMAVTGPKDVERPDSDFAFVPKGKPKSARKLPIFDAAHVRNALARLNQTEGIPPSEMPKVKARICSAAKKFGVKTDLCSEKSSKNIEGFSIIPLDRPVIHI